MLIDSITMSNGGFASGIRPPAGDTFPTGAQDSDQFRLNVQSGTNKPGLYWYDAVKTAWINVAEPVYDIAGSCNGKPTASATLTRFETPRAFSLQAALPGSVSDATAAATLAATLLIFKDAVQIGTITFAAGSKVGVMALTADTTFAIRNVLTVVAPAAVDATLANITFTFVTKPS